MVETRQHVANTFNLLIEPSIAEQPRNLGMPMPGTARVTLECVCKALTYLFVELHVHDRVPSISHSDEPMSGPYIPPPADLISAFSPVDTNPTNAVRKKEVVLGSRTAIYAIMDTCLKETLLSSVPGNFHLNH